jgi:predicted transport protein
MPKPLSPQQMIDAIARNLPERTGRTLQEWVALLEKDGPEGRKERLAWLRNRQLLGGATAMVIVHAAEGRSPLDDYADAEALVASLFSDRRAALRPVYEKVLKAARKLGKDVTPGPRKTYVALSRARQFAVVQPTTGDRVDLGLVLPGVTAKGRLEDARGVGSGRVTHRIALRRPADVDAFVVRWLREAYDRNG